MVLLVTREAIAREERGRDESDGVFGIGDGTASNEEEVMNRSQNLEDFSLLERKSV